MSNVTLANYPEAFGFAHSSLRDARDDISAALRCLEGIRSTDLSVAQATNLTFALGYLRNALRDAETRLDVIAVSDFRRAV